MLPVGDPLNDSGETEKYEFNLCDIYTNPYAFQNGSFSLRFGIPSCEDRVR